MRSGLTYSAFLPGLRWNRHWGDAFDKATFRLTVACSHLILKREGDGVESIDAKIVRVDPI